LPNRRRPIIKPRTARTCATRAKKNLQAADLKTVADASEPIYGKLDEGQRRMLDGALREQLARPAAFEEGRRFRSSAE
jgi:hypothetical protein